MINKTFDEKLKDFTRFLEEIYGLCENEEEVIGLYGSLDDLTYGLADCKIREIKYQKIFEQHTGENSLDGNVKFIFIVEDDDK